MRMEGWCIVRGIMELRSSQRTGTLSSAKAETFDFLIFWGFLGGSGGVRGGGLRCRRVVKSGWDYDHGEMVYSKEDDSIKVLTKNRDYQAPKLKDLIF